MIRFDLHSTQYGSIVNDNGSALELFTDWQYPRFASTFGWRIDSVQIQDEYECEHENTDGTIDCARCGATVRDFISSAREWLRENDGAMAEDPGYFLE